MRQRLLVGAALVVAALAVVSIRIVVEGRRALAEGDDAIAQKRVVDAIAAWESAARWYLPMAPHVDEAYERLTDLAKRERGVDLLAWRAVRSAAIATRGLWQPHGEKLDEANAQIARIVSKDPEGSIAAGKDPTEREAWHRERLARDPRPSGLAVGLSVVGIAAWLAGMAWLVRRWGSSRIGAGIAIGGLLLWIAGLFNA